MPTDALLAAAACGRADSPACTCSARAQTRTQQLHAARTPAARRLSQLRHSRGQIVGGGGGMCYAVRIQSTVQHVLNARACAA
eukprot:6205990-Pleurochrysis_carterae.AAC.1